MKNRISILDGFRTIAIISVMLFHYFTRYNPPFAKISLYPYQSQYNYFKLGYLGVHFFFIISGFVIFFTIDNTKNFALFWEKRLVRLLPSIIFGSLFTLIFLVFFDIKNIFPDGHDINNLLVSLTFISPTLINNLFSKFGFKVEYLNGSYWSLWPEIQFYLFSSLIFYFGNKNFLKTFLIISSFLILVDNVFTKTNLLNNYEVLRSNYIKWSINGFNLPEYLPFFSIGVLFYQMFKDKNLEIKTRLFQKTYLGAILILLLITCGSNGIRLTFIAMYTFFLCFIYYPQIMGVFKLKILTKIGESSYFLYLIHEKVGVFLIFQFGKYFMPISFIWPLILIILFVFFSYIFTLFIDKKINRWLITKLNI